MCTKGRYIAPRDRASTTDERPLYICIQAVEKQAVEKAIFQIQQFISEHTSGSILPPPVVSQSLVPNHPPPPIPMIQDKVYINLDHAPASFKVLERVLGPGGDNVNYIQNETNVSVTLRGQGYSTGCDEPFHLFLEYVNIFSSCFSKYLISFLKTLLRHVEPKAIESARSLALSLVGTLQQDFVQWQREQQQQQQSQQQVVYTFTQPYYGG